MAGLQYMTCEKTTSKVGLFSLEKGLRWEQVLSSTTIQGQGFCQDVQRKDERLKS